tara:strand:- start:461 stop:667 length:207 start_codon:yes stop_codon:yes gene_type:complete
VIDFLTPVLFANVSNEWIQKIREHESEKNRDPIEDVINKSLEDFKNESDNSTEQEELPQHSCNEDQVE